MANLGVHVHEQATSVNTPRVAAVGIPFVVGTAPVQSASKPGNPNMPVLATSWNEAVEKLGYSEDWEAYTLCEFMYSHFQLHGAQPAIFCNVLDPATMKAQIEKQEYSVADHKAVLPITVIADDTLMVEYQENSLVKDTDYSVFYDGNACIVELLSGGEAYNAERVIVTGNEINLEAVTDTEIALGVAQVDACMTAVGVVPDLICAPGWSHKPTVAAVMATKAGAINGLFKGKAVVDIDSSAAGVTDYSGLSDYKNKNNLVDENQIVCWPMVKNGDHLFHLSTQLCGLMATVDAGNRGIPYESPSNEKLKIDACVLADGTEVNLTWDQINLIAGSWGIVTAVNLLDTGWVAKGNYTACYPNISDVKDVFIPVSRMFDYIGNTLVRTFSPVIDDPMAPSLRNSVLQSCNNWLAGLSSSGYLYGARAILVEDENPTTSLREGKLTLHIYNAPPVPLQELDFILEYDVSYMESALSA